MSVSGTVHALVLAYVHGRHAAGQINARSAAQLRYRLLDFAAPAEAYRPDETGAAMIEATEETGRSLAAATDLLVSTDGALAFVGFDSGRSVVAVDLATGRTSPVPMAGERLIAAVSFR